MTRKKTHNASSTAPTGNSKVQQEAKGQSSDTFFRRTLKWFTYAALFLGFWFFSSITYGDIFTRAVQESFICSDQELMKSLTDQSFGPLYVYGRYLLLIFHNKFLGGLILSLLLTGSVFFLDRALRLPLGLKGITALVPAGMMAYFVSSGIRLYYKSEPSLFLLVTVLLFFFALAFGIAMHRFHKNKTVQTADTSKRLLPIGLLTAIVAVTSLNIYATTSQENTILTARMQNRILENDLPALVEDGLDASQPSRSVAAYYAVGLLQTDRILSDLFNISFHFPDIHLNDEDGSGEYGIFAPDCNFYSGLINASYRSAMDQVVMNGPRLYYLKRMAICAIMNEEKALAEKYLNIIDKVPFENDFVEQYRPLAEHPELILQDPILSRVRSLYPQEQKFEQHYRNPTFLGYNVGILQGTNQALAPSIAACLYSKDLANMTQRAIQLKSIMPNLPLPILEAVSIFSRKNPGVLQYFPELNPNQQFPHTAVANVNNFFIAIQNHFQEKYNNAPDWRQKMSEELSRGIGNELRSLLTQEWKGHYCYYYYCENIKPKQVKNKEKGEIN